MKRFTASLLLGAIMLMQIPSALAGATTVQNVWLSSKYRGLETSYAGENGVQAGGFTLRQSSAYSNMWMREVQFSVYMDENADGIFTLNGDGVSEVDDVIKRARLTNVKGDTIGFGKIDQYNGTITFNKLWVYLAKGKKKDVYVTLDLKDNAPDIDLYVDIANVMEDIKGENGSGVEMRFAENSQSFPNNAQRTVRVYAD